MSLKWTIKQVMQTAMSEEHKEVIPEILVIGAGIAHPAKDYGMRGGHSLRLSARHSQRRAFDIGFAVKLTALLSALAYAPPYASFAMPVFPCLTTPPALFGYPGAAASHRGSLRSVSPCS